MSKETIQGLLLRAAMNHIKVKIKFSSIKFNITWPMGIDRELKQEFLSAFQANRSDLLRFIIIRDLHPQPVELENAVEMAKEIFCVKDENTEGGEMLLDSVISPPPY